MALAAMKLTVTLLIITMLLCSSLEEVCSFPAGRNDAILQAPTEDYGRRQGSLTIQPPRKYESPQLVEGAGSSHEVVPSLLQTLLEGSVEQLYAGPISRYNIDESTSAALTALKKCIDELSPEHVKALVNLLKLIRTEA